LIGELREAGLLSDRRFCEAFVRARAERGQGPLRIARDLARRGVEQEALEAALAGQEGRWAGRAARARAKRFGAAPPAAARERARQTRFLEQRGFTYDQIRAALEGAGDEQDRDEAGGRDRQGRHGKGPA